MEFVVHTIKNGPLKQNCYIVETVCDAKMCLIIDPGSDSQQINNFLDNHHIHPVAIINTHGHFDHIGAVKALQELYQIPFYIHQNEKKLVRRANLYATLFESIDKIDVPKRIDYFTQATEQLKLSPFDIRIIHTPGHTPGSVCLMIEKLCFVGDTLFKGGIGRTDLPGGNQKDLMQSLSKLFDLDKDTQLYPGHGPVTSIADEINSHLSSLGAKNNAS